MILMISCFVVTITGMHCVFGHANEIDIVLIALQKFDKNIRGQLEILTSILFVIKISRLFLIYPVLVWAPFVNVTKICNSPEVYQFNT